MRSARIQDSKFKIVLNDLSDSELVKARKAIDAISAMGSTSEERVEICREIEFMNSLCEALKERSTNETN